MAYSLNDVYQSLRTAMRLNGLTIGIGLGGILLLAPTLLTAAQTAPTAAPDLFTEPLWPYRMAGALLIALGAHLLSAANERHVRASTMLAMLIGNGLIAVVLLMAFLQRELIHLSNLAHIIFGAVFFLCLVCAGFALRYLRQDYNMA